PEDRCRRLAGGAGREDLSLAGKISAQHERPRDARGAPQRIRLVQPSAARNISAVPIPVPGEWFAGPAASSPRTGAGREAGGGQLYGRGFQPRSSATDRADRLGPAAGGISADAELLGKFERKKHRRLRFRL